MKKTIILMALIGIFLAGCTGLIGHKEIKIESGRNNCNDIGKSLVSPAIKDMAKQECAKACEEKAYNYSKWDCTKDKVVCTCVKK